MDPKISVAMACFNSERFISKAIKSIVRQKYKNWEIIICDDASTDKSIKIIQKSISSYNIENKVKILRHDKNYGYGKTLKDAIEGGDGELIAIIDSDDALAVPNAFGVMLKRYIKYPKASLIYSNYYKCGPNLISRRKGPSRQLKNNESYINTKIRISHLKIFKRSAYNKTEGVNPNLRKCVDKDLVLKLEEVGRLIYVNKELYLYRCHKNNLTKSIHRKPKSYRIMVTKMRKQIYIDAKKRRGLIK